MTVSICNPARTTARGLATLQRWSLVWPVSLAAAPTAAPDASEVKAGGQLMARIAQGDEEAFRQLVEQHQDRLLAVSERLLGEVDEARDVVQETFLQAYRHAPRYNPSGSLGGWLYRITVNECLRRRRRRKILTFLRLAEPQEESLNGVRLVPPSTVPDAYRHAQARRQWAAVRRVLDRLPEGQRTVLIRIKLEGLSYREVARILGISESAVDGRLVRALRRLRRALEDPGLEPRTSSGGKT